MRRSFVFAVGSMTLACSQAGARRAPPAELPIVDSGSAVTVDSSARDTSVAVTDSGVDSAVTETDATSSPPDLGPPPDVTVIDRCSGPYAAFTSKGLVAGGMTPKAFASAYNSAVAALAYPGPMLLAFKGVNGTDASRHKVRIGGLDLMGAGPDVKFHGPTAEIDFVMGTGITLKIPEQLATFKLRFSADVPVSAIRLTAAAGDCTEISVDSLVLLIPETAREIPFAGSTVGALMGSSISSDAGPNVWVLELLGSDKKATIGGGGP